MVLEMLFISSHPSRLASGFMNTLNTCVEYDGSGFWVQGGEGGGVKDKYPSHIASGSMNTLNTCGSV